jgi:hypothetical protein
MPLQATSGTASYDAFGGGVPAIPNYIEDVFSTYLYTGNGSTQTITNGIDLSTKGGAVWMKARDVAYGTVVQDTARGVNKYLLTHSTNGEASSSATLNAFNSNGFTIGSGGAVNQSGNTFVSWTFRKQPKFFDVVTYTGTGTVGQVVPHSLGAVPACVIYKQTSVAGEHWGVYHRSLPTDRYLWLDATNAQLSLGNRITALSSTDITIGNNPEINNSGDSYVMYIFAHDAGGFGLTGTDNVISCGSFTTDGSGNATVDLGYEPQWVLIKKTNGAEKWELVDNMRGFTVSGGTILVPNSTQTDEATVESAITNTGFKRLGVGASATYIYIAIRRGPMKVPTSGTSVFSAVAYTGNGSTTRKISTTITPDLSMTEGRSSAYVPFWNTRLTGANLIYSSSTGAERLPSGFTDGGFGIDTNSQAGIAMAAGSGATANNSNANAVTYINWNFQRAPSFFDVVCYTGTGVTSRTFNHNLTVVPEMIIYKTRSLAGEEWGVYTTSTGIGNVTWLNRTNATSAQTERTLAVSSTTITIGNNGEVNGSGATYVAYLFATCAGVSKVGSYTGTGTTLQVNCGFTGGARFVLIKRSDSTGDWYVWDTARGIVSGNDPYLLLNSTAAEVTSTDYIDTYSAGFEISSTAPAAINASGGTFIFLAIA